MQYPPARGYGGVNTVTIYNASVDEMLIVGDDEHVEYSWRIKRKPRRPRGLNHGHTRKISGETS